MMKYQIALISVVLLSACASSGGYTDMGYRPVVDLQPGQTNYQQDLDDCARYAQQRQGAGQSAAAGAVAGAIVGGLLGALFGDSRLAGQMAVVGAVSTAPGAAATAEGTQRDIVRRCLAGRGYRVLD